MYERERGSGCVCVCVRERERERVCVCKRERERVCVDKMHVVKYSLIHDAPILHKEQGGSLRCTCTLTPVRNV